MNDTTTKQLLGENRTACVIRGGLWDSTQATPRAVNALIDLGFDVKVLCWNINGDLPLHEKREGFEIFRYDRKIPPASPKYFLCWPLWWIWLFFQYRKIKPDLIHSMNVDSVFPAIFSRLFRRTKIVFDVRDAWGQCLTAKPWPIARVFQMFERFNGRFADAILLSQGCIDVCAEYFGKGVAKNTLTIQVLNVPQDDYDGQRLPPNNTPMKVNFSGRLSGLRAAFKLADAIEDNPKLEIDVYGKLSDDKIRERYEPIKNATFDGLVTHDESLRRMNEADLISLFYDPSLTVVFIASANKMFEAMMLGKPYICTKGSYPHRVAERHQLGWGIDYANQDELVELLNHLADHPEERIARGENGRKAYEEHYRWDIQKQNLLKLYDHLFDVPTDEPRANEGWSRFLGNSSG